MKHTGADAFSEERLSRTWRTSILPLLQEHHYGQWERVAARYQLDSLIAAATPPDGPADDRPVESDERTAVTTGAVGADAGAE